MRERYIEHRDKLIIELHLKHLDIALRRYRPLAGKSATQLEELVTAGLLPAIPAGPFESTYYIGDNGRAHTTAQEHRLRLMPAGKNPELQQ